MGLIGKTLNLRMNLLEPSIPKNKVLSAAPERLEGFINEICLGQAVMTTKPDNPAIIKEDLVVH